MQLNYRIKIKSAKDLLLAGLNKNILLAFAGMEAEIVDETPNGFVMRLIGDALPLETLIPTALMDDYCEKIGEDND